MSPSIRTRPRRLAARIGIGVVVGAAAAVIAASAASAHVKVSGDVQQGGSGVITFRAPSESATASTTELTITFPTKTPIVSVDTQPMAGGKSTVTTAKLAKPLKADDGETTEYVSKVDWKADTPADGIPAGEFDMFNLSVGPLPNTASVTFPALQYYSDGSTVNWNEISADGTTEPEHPAPVLELAAATTTTPSGSATNAPTVTTTPAASSSGPDGFGIAGLIAGILGLIAGVIALLRTPRNPTAAP